MRIGFVLATIGVGVPCSPCRLSLFTYSSRILLSFGFVLVAGMQVHRCSS